MLSVSDSTVVFNEINYNPGGQDQQLEWIELYNQMAVDMELSNWRFEGGVQFQFPPGTILKGGEYLVIAKDPASLLATTGFTGAIGPFTGNLSNGGDHIILRNHNDRLMDEIEYDDSEPWPIGADGSGVTLAKYNKISPSAPPENWRLSDQFGGTPGAANFVGIESTGPQLDTLIGLGATAGVLVPGSGILGTSWTQIGFDDSSWIHGQTGVGFDTYELPTPPAVVTNVALGKPVINGTGAYFNNPYNGMQGVYNFSALTVTDGSTADVFGTNYWLGREGVANESFVLDLGASYDIQEIRLRNTHNTQFNDRGTKNFRIFASDTIDASKNLISPQQILTSTLPSVANLNPIPSTNFTTGNGLTRRFARYLRFEALSAQGVNNNVGLNEIEVYALSTSSPATNINHALGKQVIDGSGAYYNNPFNVAQGEGQDFSAGKVTDGSTTDISGVNYWLGREGVANEYFTLDLGGLVKIDQIRLRNTHNTQYNDRGTQNFKIWASTAIDNGFQLANPQVILTGQLSNVSGQTTITADIFTIANGLTLSTARYLKFETLSANNPLNNVGLNEIEVYGQANVAASRYYPLDGDASDQSGNDVPGVVNGGAAFVADVPAALGGGMSLDFDGVDDTVTIIDTTQPSAYTLSAWVKMDVVRAQTLIVRTDVTGPSSAFSHQIYVDATGKFVHYTFDGNLRSVTGTTTAVAGQWYHVAATAANNGQMRLYVNGVEQGASQAVATLWASGDRWILGSASGWTANTLDGKLDDVSIFNRALNGQEVAALAAGGPPLALAGYDGLIVTDLQTQMLNVNPTAYVRLPFTVSNPNLYDQLNFDVMYDDGFVAYLNGVEVARRNAPAMLAYNSAAAASRPDGQAVQFESIDLAPHLGLLTPGPNVLAIHAMNVSSSDDDFLIMPRLTGRRVPSVVGSIGLHFTEISGELDSSRLVEIFNSEGQGINLGGFTLESSSGFVHTFAPGVLGSGQRMVIDLTEAGFLLFEGDKLFLYTPAQAAVADAVEMGLTLRARRNDDLDGPFLSPTAPTFGSPNVFNFRDEIVINEIMYNHRPEYGVPGTTPTYANTSLQPWGATWKYNKTGVAQPATWKDPGFNDTGVDWLSGVGPLGFESATLPVPLGTFITSTGVTTYYFRSTLNVTGSLAGKTVQLRHMIDDGAIIYINGTEALRYGMPEGAVTNLTLSTLGIGDASLSSYITIPTNLLHTGLNTIAVEVHQTATSSSDMVMGMELVTSELVDPGSPGTPFADNPEEWIELYNRAAYTVDLSGWRLRDAIDYEIPTGTMIGPGEYLVIARDSAALLALHPGIDVVGDYDGRLPNSLGRIVLVDSVGNPADEVKYYDERPWPSYTDGGGSSLELRDPLADNAAAEAWAPSDNLTPDNGWQHYTYTATAINPVFAPGTFNFHQLRINLLNDGEVLLDNITVIENPGGAARQLIQNGTFQADPVGNASDKWRLMGNHSHSEVIIDPTNPANKVLRLVATGQGSYLSNRVETTLKSGGVVVPVVTGTTYQISFDARWVAGSPQVHTELYYNKVAQTTILEMPEKSGTPGAPNSRLESNIGPTYSGLIHSPAVPAAGQPIDVFVRPSDPQGVTSMTLFYSVNGAAWQNLPMAAVGDGRYTGVIPGQSAAAVIQFYVRGVDGLAANSFAPAAGPASRALIKVNDGLANANRQNFRIIMTAADSALLHDSLNILSDDRIGSTVISNESEIFYDTGIRLRGSMFSRQNPGGTGFNVSFPADHLYRGVHGSISIKRPGIREILAKHMVNHAGELPALYDDIVNMISHYPGNRGMAILSMARFGNIFLDSQYEDGSDGTVFKMEGIREINASVGNDPEGLPIPFPPGWIGNYDITNLGDSKEQYRWSIMINNNLDRDDYTDFIAMAKVFALSGSALDTAAPEVMDVDEWMRLFAMLSLAGIGDTYSQGNPHNLNFYSRPSDGKILAMPWDWDFTFSYPTNNALWGGSNISKIIARPIFTRLFYGHMLDMINTTFNSAYMAYWVNHYSQVSGENYSGDLNYINARSSFVLSQLPAQIPFQINTNGGANFSIAADSATIGGQGWINVREVRLAGSEDPLPIVWTDLQNWTLTLPLDFGANVLSLQAYDHQGNLVGSDSITITSTVSERPQRDFLRITEVMYHPTDPTSAEITAGFTDPEDFEFVEILNTGPNTVNLLDLKFVAGVNFNFNTAAITSLLSGQRVLVVSNVAAFQARYGAGLPVAGAYTGHFSNSSETVTLLDHTDAIIHEFQYADDGQWPNRADGKGSSLVVVSTSGDYNSADNWISSVDFHGTPGSAPSGVLPAVVINEILSHTTLPVLDAIELHNPTALPIDISGWWLSDSDSSYTRFQIPAGTILPAFGYIVFDESHFNPTPAMPAPGHFGLDGAHGETLYLLRGLIGNPVPTSFEDKAEFGAAFDGVSLGRVPNGSSTSTLFPQAGVTLNGPNSGPRFSPVTIAEVMYQSASNDSDLEFIELFNHSSAAVDLTGWRLNGAVDYAIPAGTMIAPLGSLVILPFDPRLPINAARAANFQATYGVTFDARFIGGYSGNLDNDGEQLRLEAPDAPPVSEPLFTPHPLVDQVDYNDALPWPLSAAGGGASLHRLSGRHYGDFSVSWAAQPPTPGLAKGDVDLNGVINSLDIDALFANRAPAPDAALPRYDLDGSGQADNLDVDLLVLSILCSFYGDANLDRQVSIGDLTILAENFGLTSGALWSMGDFTGDGQVSIGDLTLLAENFGAANSLVAQEESQAPAGLQALGDGWLGDSDQEDETEESSLVDILADLGAELR